MSGHPEEYRESFGGGFALLVVLFILLIIVGSSYIGCCY
ncbi:YjcZ family sporulation protein [Niallia sp. 01092]